MIFAVAESLHRPVIRQPFCWFLTPGFKRKPSNETALENLPMKNSEKLRFAMSCFLLMSLALHSQAQISNQAIGYVKNVTGEAWVITGSDRITALPGVEIKIGSLLKTASMGVTLKDGTLMSFGPDTELTLEEYQYAPAQKELKLVARLGKGTLNYMSGAIAKLKPDAVMVKTPVGMIGVRGTHFVVKMDAPL